jgi:hypothetical protein
VVRTASGFDPLTSALSTYVTVEVSHVHRGPADLERVILREPGGRVGDLIHAVDAVPVFRSGKQVLLFLEPGRDRIARREISGSGLIFRRKTGEVEEFPAAEIESVVAFFPFKLSIGPRSQASPEGFLAVPPE